MSIMFFFFYFILSLQDDDMNQDEIAEIEDDKTSIKIELVQDE